MYGPEMWCCDFEVTKCLCDGWDDEQLKELCSVSSFSLPLSLSLSRVHYSLTFSFLAFPPSAAYTSRAAWTGASCHVCQRGRAGVPRTDCACLALGPPGAPAAAPLAAPRWSILRVLAGSRPCSELVWPGPVSLPPQTRRLTRTPPPDPPCCPLPPQTYTPVNPANCNKKTGFVATLDLKTVM